MQIKKSYTTVLIKELEPQTTIEAYLKNTLAYSARKRQKLTRCRGIYLNGKPAHLSRILKNGDQLKVLAFEDDSIGVTPEPGTIEVLYEDDDVIVLNKPPFTLVHPAGQTTSQTLANHLAYHFQQRGTITSIRPLHRLDRDTSGCILFAKHAAAQTALEKQRDEKILTRAYFALTSGLPIPPDGTVNAPIGSHPTRPNCRTVSASGKPAITHYKTLCNTSHYAALKLCLETGRTHQIRIHLAHINTPILGDAMYGSRSPLIRRQALHACSLEFLQLKTNRRVVVSAPLPLDMKTAMHALELQYEY